MSLDNRLQQQLGDLKSKQAELAGKVQRLTAALANANTHVQKSSILAELKISQAALDDIERETQQQEPLFGTRTQELSYLETIIAEHEALIGLYTEMSIQGKSQRNDVKIKPAARRFLNIHHSVYADISHSFDEDDADVFTIQTIQELFKIIHEFKQVALVGEPGCGKTTTLQRLAHELACEAKENIDCPLPVLVKLGNQSDLNINEFFDQFFNDLPLQSYIPNRVVLLLDGLNEMRAGQLDKLSFWLTSNESVKVVVSCRRLDYVERKLPLKRVDVLPLDFRQIYTFIGNFLEDSDRDRLFWALAGSQARGAWEWYRRTNGTQAAMDDFWLGTTDHVHSYEVEKGILKDTQDKLRQDGHLPGLLDLVTNPFLLASVIFIYAHNESLPQNRGQLFEKIIELQIKNRGRISVTLAHPWISDSIQQAALGLLAYKMLQEKYGTGVDESWVLTILQSEFAEHDPANLLYLAIGAGILEAKRTRGKDTIRFSHQLFQEYFAASRMSRLIGNSEASIYWPGENWWVPTGWENPVLLLAGILRDATPVVEWLVKVNPSLAYRCTTEAGVKCSSRAMELLYDPLPGTRSSPYARAERGRILAQTKDMRPGVGLGINGLPDIVWSKVPPGKFTMGGDDGLEALGLSRGRHDIDLDYPYWISKYPITCAQFGEFLIEGYGMRKFWTAAGWRWKGSQKQPRYWDNPTFNISNHPVVGVTWFEAFAFTLWLDDLMHTSAYPSPDQALTAWEICLPLEAEWEKAARFPDNRRYPWGSDYIAGCANIDETFQGAECGPHFLRRTTAVGMYEAGKSFLGIYDLCGNVWEWCLSKWDVEYIYPENIDPSGTDHRGVRGGSWYNSAQFASSAAHDCLDADLGVSDVGFRVVLRPLINGQKQR